MSLMPFKGRCMHCGHDHDAVPSIFQTVTDLQAEVSRLTALNTQLCKKSNHYLIESARLEDDNKRLTAELAAVRTGDTCGRQCEGEAYRIEARRLRAELAEAVERENNAKCIRCGSRLFEVEDRPVPAAQAVPDGYVLAPIEPTPEMATAGFNSACSHACISAYKAMLAAAPHTPVSDGDALLYAAEAQRGGQ